jgi:hypothetical protein
MGLIQPPVTTVVEAVDFTLSAQSCVQKFECFGEIWQIELIELSYSLLYECTHVAIAHSLIDHPYVHPLGCSSLQSRKIPSIPSSNVGGVSLSQPLGVI